MPSTSPTACPIQSLTQANLAGGRTDDGWAQEEALDVEWAHAIAPGASFLVVEAASDQVSDLMVAVNFARNSPGVSVVSMSWGGSEFRGQSGYDQYLHHSGRPQRRHLRDRQRRLRAASSELSGRRPLRTSWPSAAPRSEWMPRAMCVSEVGVVRQRRWTEPVVCPARLPGVRSAQRKTHRRPTSRWWPIPPRASRSTRFRPSDRPGLLAGPRRDQPLRPALRRPGGHRRSRAGHFAGRALSMAPAGRFPLLYSLPSSDYRDVTRGWTGFCRQLRL